MSFPANGLFVCAGAQYCAWNRASTLLAVSSDALRAIFVFDPRTKARVFRAENHPRPCLALAWAPWADSVLVYCEESKAVHIRDVKAGPEDVDANQGEALRVYSSLSFCLIRKYFLPFKFSSTVFFSIS
jgi:WD40 repeat protein